MKNAIRFSNLRIKHREHSFSDELSAAEYWLDSRGLASVFYGLNTADEVISGLRPIDVGSKAYGELQEFVKVHEQSLNGGASAVFVTVDERYVWIYEAIGHLKSDKLISFDRDGVRASDVPKCYEIRLLLPKLQASEVPLGRMISQKLDTPAAGDCHEDSNCARVSVEIAL